MFVKILQHAIMLCFRSPSATRTHIMRSHPRIIRFCSIRIRSGADIIGANGALFHGISGFLERFLAPSESNQAKVSDQWTAAALRIAKFPPRLANVGRSHSKSVAAEFLFKQEFFPFLLL